jgi:hypothetical protein
MSDLRYPSWQEHVRLAVLEPNPQKLKVKIAAGLQAIEDRRAQLSGDHNTRDERIALDDALQTLQVLSRYLAA